MADTKETGRSSDQPVARKSSETVYTRQELMDAAATFGTTEAGMAGALRLAELTEATHAQAEKAVKTFNEREV